MSDLRQRFYIEDSPIRGEVVHLEEALQIILAQGDYAPAIQVLLGEMLSATALLASTLKIKARIRIQIQASGTLQWAMAECNHLGEVRGLADYEENDLFNQANDSSTRRGQRGPKPAKRSYQSALVSALSPRPSGGLDE